MDNPTIIDLPHPQPFPRRGEGSRPSYPLSHREACPEFQGGQGEGSLLTLRETCLLAHYISVTAILCYTDRMSQPGPAQSHPILLWISPRAGYLPGEAIERDVQGLSGEPLGRFTFTIECSAGSGFASQVYRAAVKGCEALPPIAAIKVLRPRSRMKLWLRDTLFRICFQTSFAPRLREEALRCGLAWQVLLRAAAEIELGSAAAVVQPYGYFWDAELASYVEVHEWVSGRAARMEQDEHLLARWLHKDAPPDQSEMARKKAFMDGLAGLCRRIGAAGLARQYEWWTLISQANVLARFPPSQPAAANHPAETLTAIDCRPGLAVPFFLPLSPAHARINWDGLQRGMLAHYDEADLDRLAAYLYGPSRPGILPPAGRAPRRGRARIPLRNPWMVERAGRTRGSAATGRLAGENAPGRTRGSAAAKRNNPPTRIAAAADWLRLGQVDAQTAAWLPAHPLAFYILALLGLFPICGPFLARLLGSADYRRHLRPLLANPGYRHAALAAWRSQDLPCWQSEGRISPARASLLLRSMPAYLAEKTLFAWLPPWLHHFLVDPAARRTALDRLLLQPLRLMFSQESRLTWLEGILRAQARDGMLSPERLRVHLAQLREPRMQGYIRDMGFTAGLDLFSRLVYLALGMYGLSTGDFLPLGLAVLGPIPPSGPLRALYILTFLPLDLRNARRWGQSARARSKPGWQRYVSHPGAGWATSSRWWRSPLFTRAFLSCWQNISSPARWRSSRSSAVRDACCSMPCSRCATTCRCR